MGLLNKDNERKFGNCQWCGKHNTMLNFAIGQCNGKLWSGWICNDCYGVKKQEELPYDERTAGHS